MKTIEERAKEVGILSQVRSDYPYDKRSVEFGYTQGAIEQKDIDNNNLQDKLDYCKEIKKQVDNIKDLVILLLIWISIISIIFCVGSAISYDDIKQDIKEISTMEE